MNFISENQFVTTLNGHTLFIKREDLLHRVVSGNKFRKLRYNLAFAKGNKYATLLTFGGAFSNHIAATAAAGEMEGFNTIGVVRGEELGRNLSKTLAENPTLAFAQRCGMELLFVSRQDYRNKETIRFRESIQRLNPYVIPEGGTNDLAIKGCEEILTENDKSFDYICCSAGTGGTVSGIINSLKVHQKALVFPALKGDWMPDELRKYVRNEQWEVVSGYHFGGYAKVNTMLVEFMNQFYKRYKILLDPVYTGKMLFGIFELMNNGFFRENSRILAIHTGGLQGIAGMNLKLTQKGLPVIDT